MVVIYIEKIFFGGIPRNKWYNIWSNILITIHNILCFLNFLLHIFRCSWQNHILSRHIPFLVTFIIICALIDPLDALILVIPPPFMFLLISEPIILIPLITTKTYPCLTSCRFFWWSRGIISAISDWNFRHTFFYTSFLLLMLVNVTMDSFPFSKPIIC